MGRAAPHLTMNAWETFTETLKTLGGSAVDAYTAVTGGNKPADDAAPAPAATDKPWLIPVAIGGAILAVILGFVLLTRKS